MTKAATTEAPASTALVFDGGMLAAAWLGVAQASARDENRPMLSRTVCVEVYAEGARLVATDGYVILHAWVPDARTVAADPGDDVAPDDVVIAIDSYGRAAGLMGHLRRLAAESEETGAVVEVVMRVGELPSEVPTTVPLEGLEARALIFDHPGREELALPLFEGTYPDWRPITVRHTARSTKEIALNPEILGRLAKLGKLYAEPLVWRFGGREGPALLTIGPIRGVAMPMRWAGFDTEAITVKVEVKA